MKCTFCGLEIEKGTGKTFVYDDGKQAHFCSSKCEKNLGLGRKPIHTKWSKRFKK